MILKGSDSFLLLMAVMICLFISHLSELKVSVALAMAKKWNMKWLLVMMVVKRPLM